MSRKRLALLGVFVVAMAIFVLASPWLRALFGVRAWVSGSQPATVPALT